MPRSILTIVDITGLRSKSVDIRGVFSVFIGMLVFVSAPKTSAQPLANAEIIGFAVDIVLVAKTIPQIEALCNQVVDMVENWLNEARLAMAPQKTEAVLISSRKVVEYCTIKVGDCLIQSRTHIKYLGIIIDRRLTYKEHLIYASEKASQAASSLARIMANKRGPRQTGRKLLATVAASILLYAAPIWVEATLIKSYAKQSACVRRFCALRVCSAYRTVSDDASLVIAGLYPVELLAIEARDIRNLITEGTKPHIARTLCRRNTIQLWQLCWSASKKGVWTYYCEQNVR